MIEKSFNFAMPTWEDMENIMHIDTDCRDGFERIKCSYSTKCNDFILSETKDCIIIDNQLYLTKERWNSFLNGNISDCHFTEIYNERKYHQYITSIYFANGKEWNNPFCVTSFS